MSPEGPGLFRVEALIRVGRGQVHVPRLLGCHMFRGVEPGHQWGDMEPELLELRQAGGGVEEVKVRWA